LPKLDFDDAFHVAMVDDVVYFGSSVDNGVHAFDATSGARRWTFFTEGPVRVAPTIANGRVYAGSDDGTIYCLSARDGKLIWRTRPYEGRTKILGAGRVMSLWPVGTGMLVEDGKVYCGAGLFPAPGTAVLALNALDGSVIWKTSRTPKVSYATLAPQGYPIAAGDRMFFPCGRSGPLTYAMSDGVVLEPVNKAYKIVRKKGVASGGYGVLVDTTLYVGSQNELHGYSVNGTHVAFWADTRRIVATAGRYLQLVGQPPRSARTTGPEKAHAVVAVSREAFTPSRRRQRVPKGAREWTSKAPGLQKMIVAGPNVIVGGRNEVVALDASTGQKVWVAKVNGVAKGLAVANGRLVVSTDRGNIHCFGTGVPARRADHLVTLRPKPEVAALARSVAGDAAIRRGYGLVLGEDAVHLAVELAKLTDMRMHVVQSDDARAAHLRKTLQEAGLYGSSVLVDLLHAGDKATLPYPPYFANLIVANVPATDEDPVTAREILRVLKPCGGTLYVARRRDADAWTGAGMLSQVRLTRTDTRTKLVRGRLAGARDWTHQYADAGNTSSSDDLLVRGRPTVLWYGEPGANRAQDRHRRSEAPLSLNGRMYAQGIRAKDNTPLLLSFDAYNGVKYWERDMPGAERIYITHDCSDLACSPQGLFLALGKSCVRLDLLTGESRSAFSVPSGKRGNTGDWAYVATDSGILVGSSSSSYLYSDSVFGYDVTSGEMKWQYQGAVIKNSTVAIHGGKVFSVEHRGQSDPPVVLNPLQRARLKAKRRGAPAPKKPAGPIENGYTRTVVALDLQTGKVTWARDHDLTGCGGWRGSLCAIAKKGVVLLCGAYSAYGRPKGNEHERRALALSAADGSVRWNEAIGNRVRPIVVGDRVIGRPRAHNLLTGKPSLRADTKRAWSTPATGACGQMSASAGTIFFRYGYTLMVNVDTGGRMLAFVGIRPGCLINIIPAGGVVVQVEGSSGCQCYHPLQATVAFVPAGT